MNKKIYINAELNGNEVTICSGGTAVDELQLAMAVYANMLLRAYGDKAELFLQKCGNDLLAEVLQELRVSERTKIDLSAIKQAPEQ